MGGCEQARDEMVKDVNGKILQHSVELRMSYDKIC